MCGPTVLTAKSNFIISLGVRHEPVVNAQQLPSNERGEPQPFDERLNIIESEESIYAREREFTAKHMGLGRQKWFLHKGKLLPMFRNKPDGKAWRMKLQQGTLTAKDWECIPPRLRKVFCSAEVCKNKHGQRRTAEMYTDIFTAPITLRELDKYIAKTKKNTAPGVSGVRIDHIAALPSDLRTTIAELLSIPYLTGLSYTAWGEEIVNWVPKECRRPLYTYR